MIVNDRIQDYILSLEMGNGELADSIEAEALKDGIPIIRRETAALLKTIITAKAPENILEVGTAVGYSALLMSHVMPKRCHITTIEKYEPRIKAAKENFRRAGEEERITLLEGDAWEHLEKLSQERKKFDFVFMDAAKGQYLYWLPVILSMLPEGGILFSDNVFQGGDIVQSRYAVERRDRTIHKRMREYLYELTRHKELQTALIPVGDGAAFSVKTGKGMKKYL
ncbi:O-methyltransferase [Lachnospiraceae bacterium 62-35]